MYAAPDMLTTMAIDLLPEDLENKVIDLPELNTHTEVIAWVKRRLEYKRQKKMADYDKQFDTLALCALVRALCPVTSTKLSTPWRSFLT